MEVRGGGAIMLHKLKTVIAYVIQVNEVLPTLFQLIANTTVYKHKCTGNKKVTVKIKHDE